MLRETVAAALEKAFGETARLDRASRNFATFAASHPEVGEIWISDDGDEITVSVGKITHGHFGSYQPGLTEEERESAIAQDVVGFLSRLFRDEVFLFTSRFMGGWKYRELITEKDPNSSRRTWYRWSGPVDPKHELS